jgi:hypothetical protein
MTSTDPQRWARGLPHLLWKRPGLPRDWVRVLERHPEGVQGLPGYVWLAGPGWIVLEVWVAEPGNRGHARRRYSAAQAYCTESGREALDLIGG